MSDQIIREIPRIRRYAKHNAEQDFQFRNYLKFQLPMSNADLDTDVRETTDLVWKKIDCLTCGNCCKTLQIVVDASDIKRLSARLGIGERLFVKKYVQRASDGAQHFISSPCAFLGEDNKCAVYEERPQACRDFPYLRDPNFRKRSLMMVANCKVCPIVFNVWQELKRKLWRKR